MGGGWGNGEKLLNGLGVLVCSNKNVLEQGRGGG